MQFAVVHKPDTKLNVIHIITGLGGGGAEGALFRLSTNLPPNVRVTVISLMDDGVYGPRLRAKGIEVISLGISGPLSALTGLWRLYRILRALNVHVIQTWMYHADLVGGIAGRLIGVPVCWGIRTANLGSKSKRLTRWVAHLCGWLSTWVPDHAISCSEKAVQAHQHYGYRVPMTVIPNGYDLAHWRSSITCPHSRGNFGLAESDVVLAHAARAHPLKDHANLARAFSLAHRSEPRLKLLLCGLELDEESPYFQALPFTVEARKAVRALGARDDLPRLWGLADAFVLSSVVEGFPNVVAEAMASGMPAIVTDVGDAALIVGQTGIVVPRSDSSALADAMMQLSAMPETERRQLGEAAARRVEENFGIERMVSGFMSVWHSIRSRTKI